MKHSVIICSYNRSASLKDTIESLVKQECDWDSVAEIIIVDNNSTDGTEKLIRSYATSFKTRLIYLKEKRQGKSHALNLAITTSRGDVLVFTDDDVILDPKWLNEIMRSFKENEIDVLGGRTLPLYSAQTPEWVRQNQFHLSGPIVSYDYGEDTIDYSSGKIPKFIGANVAFKKDLFVAAGLYNIDLGVGRGIFGEDTEMFLRIVRLGKRVFYNGKALVWHTVDPKRMTLKYVARWFFQYGKTTAVLNMMEGKEKLALVGRIPRYLFGEIMLKFVQLLLSMFQPKSFLKCWCALNSHLGMMAGYAKYTPITSPQKRDDLS